MSEPQLSIVVPCYNEEHRLGRSLTTILGWAGAQPFDTELVIVDDGSSDGTRQLAESALEGVPRQLLVHDRNRGKGAALRTGMTAARGRIVLFTDADLSTPITFATAFLRAHEDGVPMVIGTRKSAGAQVTRRQAWLRESMGKVFTWLSNRMLSTDVSDFTCGFKSFERTAARDIFSRMAEDGWAYDSEVVYLANRLGYAFREVPVTWENDPSTRVRLVRDAIGSFMGLVRIRRRGAAGAYSRSGPESNFASAADADALAAKARRGGAV